LKRIHIEYEAPQHGWLPLKISIGEQSIDIDSSDVPNNPIQDLLEAIRLASQGEDSRVWWPLEPGGFVFDFRCLEHVICLQICLAGDEWGKRMREIASVEGTPQDILLPFWRFLREFQSHGFTEPHWPDVDYRDIESIGRRLK
jgi:hypothetical protein